MNWTTELINTFRNEAQVRRDSRISQILGDEEPHFPDRLPFLDGYVNIRNTNIIVELTEEEIMEFHQLKEIPNTIFNYFNQQPFLYQSQLFDSLFMDRFSLIRKGRQVGITNLLLNFVLHQVLTNNNSHNLIVGVKDQDLHHIQLNLLGKLGKIPIGFQKGLVENNKFKMKWENGSSITLFRDSKLALSQNYNNIILLDASYFNDLSMILNSIVPAVSARRDGRIILEGNITTKNSFFNDLCGGNKFPFQEKIINSLSFPNRDGNWEAQQIKMVGLENYLAEFLCLIPGAPEWNREINLHQLLDKK